MDSSLPSATGARSARRWSLLAGAYAFCCAALTAASLSTVLDLFGEVNAVAEKLEHREIDGRAVITP